MISARSEPWTARRRVPGELGLGFSLRSIIQKGSVPVGTAVGTVFGNPVAGAAAGAVVSKLAQKKEDDDGATASASSAPSASPTSSAPTSATAFAAPKSKLPWLVGGGVGALALLGLIIYLAARRPAAVVVTTGKTNPRRRRNPRAVFYTMRDIKLLLRKRKAAKKSNPLRRGWTRPAISGNIATLRREGYPQRQAVAIAMSTARRFAGRRRVRGLRRR